MSPRSPRRRAATRSISRRNRSRSTRGQPVVLATVVVTTALVDLAKRPIRPMTPEEITFATWMNAINPAFTGTAQRPRAAERRVAQGAGRDAEEVVCERGSVLQGEGHRGRHQMGRPTQSRSRRRWKRAWPRGKLERRQSRRRQPAAALRVVSHAVSRTDGRRDVPDQERRIDKILNHEVHEGHEDSWAKPSCLHALHVLHGEYFGDIMKRLILFSVFVLSLAPFPRNALPMRPDSAFRQATRQRVSSRT